MDDLQQLLPDLTSDLWRLLAQVPAGRVTTYGRLAEALGDRIAARWVGHAMLHHDHTDDCPCHRVVRADGGAGLFAAGDATRKLQRLNAECVAASAGRVDLGRYGFADFRSAFPLTRLREYQESMARKFSSRGPRHVPELIGAVDVSYTRAGEAVAAYGLFALGDEGVQPPEALWSTTLRQSVNFPYISSYLAFRELPVLLALVDQARQQGRLAPLILVDGSGILHPRQAGIATMLGIIASVATVGLTKKRLCGDVDLRGMGAGEMREVLHAGAAAGWAVAPSSGTRKPLYISPGHRCNPQLCGELMTALMVGKTSTSRRLPLPIYFVDRLSREVARGEKGPKTKARAATRPKRLAGHQAT